MGDAMIRTALMSGAAVWLAFGTTTVMSKPAKAVRRPTPPAATTAAEPPAGVAATQATANGLMTPKEVKLRPTTPAEAEANAVWSTRAALNIAALQCQFSPVSRYGAELQ